MLNILQRQLEVRATGRLVALGEVPDLLTEALRTDEFDVMLYEGRRTASWRSGPATRPWVVASTTWTPPRGARERRAALQT